MTDDSDERARARVHSVLNEKWTLERLIGQGGMGAVYAARHRNGARAAVKVLHAQLAQNADVRQRFLREGYAANKVEHPRVVKVLDDDVVTSGPDEGSAYLVMELLEGESLEDRLERGASMTEGEFLVIADAVLEVLQAAHARGVIHRDLKPENLFIMREESAPDDKVRVKVLDFGLARLTEGQITTVHGIALGTPSFMSPEQAAGRVDEIDGRTDLFSLAATGFRMIAGRPVHEGSGPVERVMAMARVAPPKLKSVAPHASEAFARVIDRALEFNRDERYASAAVMRADVQKAIEELDEAARPAVVPSKAPPVPTPGKKERTIELSAGDLESADAGDRESGAGRSARSRSGIGFVIVIMLLVGGGVGGKLAYDEWVRRGSPRGPPTAIGGDSGSAPVSPSSVLAASAASSDAADAGAESVDAAEDAEAGADDGGDGGGDASADAQTDGPTDAAIGDAGDAGPDAADAAKATKPDAATSPHGSTAPSARPRPHRPRKT